MVFAAKGPLPDIAFVLDRLLPGGFAVPTSKLKDKVRIKARKTTLAYVVKDLGLVKTKGR